MLSCHFFFAAAAVVVVVVVVAAAAAAAPGVGAVVVAVVAALGVGAAVAGPGAGKSLEGSLGFQSRAIVGSLEKKGQSFALQVLHAFGIQFLHRLPKEAGL